jgi:hypothetical protein
MTRNGSTRVALFAATITLVVTGTVAAAVTGIHGAADVPTERANRFDSPTPVVVIGDSAIAALRWVPGADNAIIGFEHTLDLESSPTEFAIGRWAHGPLPTT